MTGRDRIVLIVLVVIAALGAAWMLVVSPERKEAEKLSTEVASAQSSLQTAEGQLSQARSAQSKYADAYASVVSLGKAVPASQEVPSLVYQIAQASEGRNVDFASISAGSGSGSGSSSSSTANAAASAGFQQMPFTFNFSGTFFDLERLFTSFNRFTMRTSAGDLSVSGRLLTIQSVKLAPQSTSSTERSTTLAPVLSGTVTATAYVLPAGQGLTGATGTASPSGSATPASTTGGGSSPSAPAIVRVTP